VLGVALAVLLFLYLPGKCVDLIEWATSLHFVEWQEGLIEGGLKVLIFVLYIWLVSLIPDIKRTFMYHGAEHKSIFCYEKGLPLTVENVRKQKRFYPRCGTSFMILMLIVGIIISILIPINNTIIRTIVKLLLLPLTVGIGYELIKLAGRRDNWFTRFISAPGVWVQHITTVEPDDDMIECAIKALEAVIPEDGESDKW
jgi:uncharacterized protein YqhQ